MEKKLSKNQEKLLAVVRDIKTLVEDRLDAVTADGRILKDAFEEAESLIGKE